MELAKMLRGWAEKAKEMADKARERAAAAQDDGEATGAAGTLRGVAAAAAGLATDLRAEYDKLSPEAQAAVKVAAGVVLLAAIRVPAGSVPSGSNDDRWHSAANDAITSTAAMHVIY